MPPFPLALGGRALPSLTSSLLEHFLSLALEEACLSA